MRNATSNRIAPMLMGGITLRNGLIRGSVTEYTDSTSKAETPAGRHSCANEKTNDKTIRAMSMIHMIHSAKRARSIAKVTGLA